MVHMYYGKQGTLWGVLAPQASWMVRKILQMHKKLEVIGWNEEYVNQIDKFSIKEIYKALRGDYQKRLKVAAKLGAVQFACVTDL
ncbi:hypothetical protein H5410_062911 [Solanum commersonii]|uniref:Uncharacterized protein n=1 Tax=Solanum commersonii TaxID=4109 RepID=A0A9J5WBX2_SOLCO|nr:hypothetical protein H5410_062911 [Solanum commersonii]